MDEKYLKSTLSERADRRGFTVIEILIAVIAMGILAGLMIPRFSVASTGGHDNTLREDLRYLRTQVSCFKYQHRDVAPGYPGGDVTTNADEATFLDQMTHFTDETCRVSAAPSSVFRFGPYLAKMPPNPVNGKTGVWVVGGGLMPAADDSQPYGWIYDPTTLKVEVNMAGSDSAGVPYSSY